MQAKVTKRFSHGSQFIYNFTWLKSLTLGTENDTGGGPNGQVNDVLNRGTAKTLSGYDQTFVGTLALTYTLPKWNSKKLLSYVMSDWQMSPVLAYQSGLPIPSLYAQNNLNSVTFQATNFAPGPAFATFANRVPGVPLFTPGRT